MRPSSKTATKATGARAIAHRRPVDAVTTTPTARATIIVTIACEVVTGPRGVRYALPSANASTLAMASIVAGIPRFLVAIPLPPTTGAEPIERRPSTVQAIRRVPRGTVPDVLEWGVRPECREPVVRGSTPPCAAPSASRRPSGRATALRGMHDTGTVDVAHERARRRTPAPTATAWVRETPSGA